MPDRKPFDGQARHDHSADDQPAPDDGTVSVPGGFKNDPDEPQHPDEAIEKFRRKNLKP
jgi:hypothetical protein